jgi:lipopolysaccharide export system permease protein
MRYRQALLRELSLSSGASLVVLIAITLVTLFIRLLGEAARGELANEAVFTFLGFSLLYFLPVLLSIGIFIGVLLTFMRYWRDSEMVIWFNAGLSLTDWIKPVLTFVLPLVAVLTLLTTVVNPWVMNKKDVYKQELLSRDDTSAIAPGIFAESNAGERVYFVESLNPLTGTVRNVFMQSRDSGKLGVVVAAEGRQEKVEDGARFLILSQGRRYEGTPGKADYRIVQFEKYWMRLDPVEVKARQISARRTGTLDLIKQPAPDARGELLGRLNSPISAVVLALFALPLSFVNTRARRSFGLIAALLIYFMYNNLMSISQAWVTQDKLNLVAGLLVAHLPMAIALVVFYVYRLRLKPLRVRMP